MVKKTIELEFDPNKVVSGLVTEYDVRDEIRFEIKKKVEGAFAEHYKKNRVEIDKLIMEQIKLTIKESGNKVVVEGLKAIMKDNN